MPDAESDALSDAVSGTLSGRSPRESAPASVAVLAGGLGRRLGGAKALVVLDRRTLISYPVRAAREAGLEAIIVAKRDTELPAVHATRVDEPDCPRHPLCGILAALAHVRRTHGEPRGVLAVGCDMPFLTPQLLAWLAGQGGGETVVAEVGGELQPFPAVYGPAAAPALEDALRAASPVRVALRELGPRVLAEEELRAFGDPHRLCFSVNDARDLARARAWISKA